MEVAELKLLEQGKKVSKLEELSDSINRHSRSKLVELFKDLAKT